MFPPFDPLSREWFPFVRDALALLGAGLIGVLLRHSEHVRQGNVFSMTRLLWEMPTVIACAIFVPAGADWLEMTRWQAGALGVVLGYVGPQIVVGFILSRLGIGPAAPSKD